MVRGGTGVWAEAESNKEPGQVTFQLLGKILNYTK